MKRVIFLLPALFAIVLLRAQAPASTVAPAVQPDISKLINFTETDHDFGKIVQGKPVEFDLFMKNVSADSVKITNVQASCGCTTPKWQPGPYAAGQTFKITVGFSGNANGPFSKIVTLYFDGGYQKIIHFHGETYKAPDNPAPANAAVQECKSSQ